MRRETACLICCAIVLHRRQVLSTKLDLLVTEAEAKALVLKFSHEDKPEMVNYFAFSNTIDPFNANNEM